MRIPRTPWLALLCALLFMLACAPPPQTATDIDQVIADQRSGEMVEAEAEISKILPDDNDGSRHQRLIVTLDSGNTLLIAHNIDLAPRVPELERGERIRFYGQYEWNPRGGVIHWTHRDPDNRHAHGWLAYRGKRYD